MKSLTIGLLTASLLFLIAGCADDDENNPGPQNQAQVTVSVSPDTIWFIYGEAVLAEILVSVTNGLGEPLADRPVAVHVDNTSIGQIDYGLQGGDGSWGEDTTDSQGQTRFPYLALLLGDNVIRAIAEGDTAYTTAVQRYPYNGIMLRVILETTPSTWNFGVTGDTASIDVTAHLYDDLLMPVPNLALHFTTQRGNLSADSAVTDADGAARVWLTGTENDFFPDSLVNETTVEVTAGISIFHDEGLINLRRP